MAKNNANDSIAQKRAKAQNQSLKNKEVTGDKHLSGPNHPAT
ncbi:hypothetical protein [Sporomusa acidovorans]|uniref:Uncharacterized protein n=1 Tax=Sporomusa acidovorans (strain ATCC 49682 / DSM 3132 / Mol) TaxID=1123286 RepID=A0ABZ3J0E2_SPOA4|nr:hypothetical protein [Sporomusa acidovorans]OZC21359.1 hypothetical protein SPACI_19860 [Sporomusa acidovorans DSM 3132]SDE56267.1 hypothetical protein SAMN04488499_101653 [Sporomusa acidovorans]